MDLRSWRTWFQERSEKHINISRAMKQKIWKSNAAETSLLRFIDNYSSSVSEYTITASCESPLSADALPHVSSHPSALTAAPCKPASCKWSRVRSLGKKALRYVSSFTYLYLLPEGWMRKYRTRMRKFHREAKWGDCLSWLTTRARRSFFRLFEFPHEIC